MPGRSLAVVAVLVVLFAGCVSPVDSGAAPAGGIDPTTTSSHAATPSASASATTATPASAGTNPWGTDPVVVAVDNEGEPGRAFESHLRAAVAYWEANAERYAGYPVAYEVRPNAANPDVVVEFVRNVPDCGAAEDAVGCAPLVTAAGQIDRPETVWIKTGLSDESTRLVLKHEFGHTLGLGHDDAPREVMQAASVLYTEPQPNATDRAFPWDDAEFTVAVDATNASDPDGAREQVSHALDYYESGAPGTPSNVTFTRVGGADAGDEQAEVVVRFGATETCSKPEGSCVNTVGTDPDGDGAIEVYTRAEIVLLSVDTPAVGWHVGYWLAFVFGAESDAEKPPPFRDADYRDRRSEWWR
ncbi:MAG: matrixin family metalloprotease [Haloferacaceae archaeon]